MRTLLKSIGRRILHQPSGMAIGRTSVIRRPRWVVNPDRIRIGEGTSIQRHARLEAYNQDSAGPLDGHIIIGNGVYIGCYCMICAMGLVQIEDGCVLSDRVYIADNAHGLDPDGPPFMSQPLESKGPVKIGRNCFIGVGASVLPGVTLGEHCIVGAQTVVTKSFPPFSMIVGNPGRIIKKYDPERKRWDGVNSLAAE